jgi:hypothetical protein
MIFHHSPAVCHSRDNLQTGKFNRDIGTSAGASQNYNRIYQWVQNYVMQAMIPARKGDHKTIAHIVAIILKLQSQLLEFIGTSGFGQTHACITADQRYVIQVFSQLPDYGFVFNSSGTIHFFAS